MRICLCLALFLGAFYVAGAQDRSNLFRTPPSHFLAAAGNDSSVDWTGGYVFARARVRLPRIIYDRSNPDYGRPGTETSISEARARARERATELATLRLTEALSNLRLDSRHSLLTKMRENRDLRDRLVGLSSRYLTRSRYPGEGFVGV